MVTKQYRTPAGIRAGPCGHPAAKDLVRARRVSRGNKCGTRVDTPGAGGPPGLQERSSSAAKTARQSWAPRCSKAAPGGRTAMPARPDLLWRVLPPVVVVAPFDGPRSGRMTACNSRPCSRHLSVCPQSRTRRTGCRGGVARPRQAGMTRNPARGKCTTTSPTRSPWRRMAICWGDSATISPCTGTLP
jgi:hypothetical protein